MADIRVFNVVDTFVALDAAYGARPLPVSDDFWEALGGGKLGQIPRMVSSFVCDEDWSSWEKHPAGEEFVCLLDGAVELLLELEGGETSVVLDRPGDFVLVPADTWHTARVLQPARMLFITPGEGTENRPV